MSEATTPVEVDLDLEDGIIRISRRGACLPLTLSEAQQVVCQVSGILLRHMPASAGRGLDLAVVERVLYRAAGVIDPDDVPAVLAAITAAHTTATPPVGPAGAAGPRVAPPGRWP